MLISRSIIQRAGVVPMSIAGIFKEVSTISISAWVFGDQLTPLNIVGVAITVSGITLYTYHKYQKSVGTEVRLDAMGRPVDVEVESRGDYVTVGASAPGSLRGGRGEREPLRGGEESVVGGGEGLQMESIRAKPAESPEERLERLRDDLEGWNDTDDWEEEADEAGEDEVVRRREEREAHGPGEKKAKWGEWWERSM